MSFLNLCHFWMERMSSFTTLTYQFLKLLLIIFHSVFLCLLSTLYHVYANIGSVPGVDDISYNTYMPVALHWPGWVTVFVRVNHLGAEPGTQAYSAWARLCGRREWVPGESWGSKQAHRVIHQPISVVSQCDADAWLNGLASGDQRRRMGNSSASEACLRRCAIQIRYFTFTLFINCS